MYNLLNNNTSEETTVIITLLIIAASILLIAIILYASKKKKDTDNKLPETREVQKEKIQINTQTSETNEIQKNTKVQYKTSPTIKVVITILIIIVMIFSIVKISECAMAQNNKDGNTSLTSRSALRSDIYLQGSDNSIFSLQYKLTPREDINNLEITFVFKDKDKIIFDTIVKYIGNVKEGNTYTISISISEFSSSSIYEQFYYSYDVTGGTIDYI